MAASGRASRAAECQPRVGCRYAIARLIGGYATSGPAACATAAHTRMREPRWQRPLVGGVSHEARTGLPGTKRMHDVRVLLHLPLNADVKSDLRQSPIGAPHMRLRPCSLLPDSEVRAMEATPFAGRDGVRRHRKWLRRRRFSGNARGCVRLCLSEGAPMLKVSNRLSFRCLPPI